MKGRDFNQYSNPDGSTVQGKMIEFLTMMNGHGLKTVIVISGEFIDGGQGFSIAGHIHKGNAARLFHEIAKSLASEPNVEERDMGVHSA